jgi:hypothetical protein
MPTPTYTLVATTTLIGATDQVVFGSLPQTFRDLILVFDGDGDNGSGAINLRFNGDTGNNYNRVFMIGNGSTASSGSSSGDSSMGAIAVANGRRMNFLFQLMDYSATDKHKTSLSRDNDSGLQAGARVFRWASTSAVTSVSIFNTAGRFISGSQFSIYGVIS